jgi:uncharacterized repeat protein (TIGR03803 family)
VLYSFKGGPDGNSPSAGVIRDAAGNLYSTTVAGGNLSCGGSGVGCGTVFKLDATGKQTVLHRFTDGADGANPMEGGVIQDAAGNLYGTTFNGADLNGCIGIGCGTVFKLDATGKETMLHRFTGSPDGLNPVGTLVRDTEGNLYGTAQDWIAELLRQYRDIAH